MTTPQLIDRSRALAMIKENSELVFPEYEDEGLVVISLVNDLLVINLGNPGAYNRYLNWRERKDNKG